MLSLLLLLLFFFKFLLLFFSFSFLACAFLDSVRTNDFSNVTPCLTWRFIVLAVGLLVEVGRSVVVKVTGMFRVSGDVVEMLTLVVGGTRHAATDDSRCIGHSRRHRRVSRRCILALQGAQRCAIRLSSLQLHRLLTLLFIMAALRSRCGHYIFAL